MTQTEFSAGPNQSIVVYLSPDMGVEIDPAAFYGAIAQDAEARAASGWRIVSTAAVRARPAGSATIWPAAVRGQRARGGRTTAGAHAADDLHAMPMAFALRRDRRS